MLALCPWGGQRAVPFGVVLVLFVVPEEGREEGKYVRSSLEQPVAGTAVLLCGDSVERLACRTGSLGLRQHPSIRNPPCLTLRVTFTPPPMFGKSVSIDPDAVMLRVDSTKQRQHRALGVLQVQDQSLEGKNGGPPQQQPRFRACAIRENHGRTGAERCKQDFPLLLIPPRFPDLKFTMGLDASIFFCGDCGGWW